MKTRTRRHYVCTVGQKHVGQAMSHVCGKMLGWGRFTQADVGKQVWIVDGHAYIENSEQRDARLGKANEDAAPRDTRPTIHEVRILKILDPCPDLSFIGEFTDQESAGVIVCQHGKLLEDLDEDETIPERGREFRFFKPYAGGEQPGSEEYRKYAHQNYDRARSHQQQDWCMVGIRARATIHIQGEGIHGSILQTIESPGIWGVESDGDCDDIARDELTTLATMLHQLNCNPEGWIEKRKAALEGLDDVSITY